MNTHKMKRALSPLIATTLLIVIAVLGGLLIYQYFGQMVNKVSRSEGIGLWAQIVYVNDTTSIVHLRIVNLGSRPITVTGLYIDGTSVSSLNLGPIAPGDIIEDVVLIGTFPGLTPGSQHVLYVTYQANGRTYTSEPLKVTVQ